MPIEARQLPQIIANLCGSWDANEIFYYLIMQMRMALAAEEAIGGGGAQRKTDQRDICSLKAQVDIGTQLDTLAAGKPH